jgi:hypothetical protein
LRIREAIEIFSRRNPWTYQDDIQALRRAWVKNHPDVDPEGVEAMEKLVYEIAKEQERKDPLPSTEDSVRAIVRGYSGEAAYNPC